MKFRRLQMKRILLLTILGLVFGIMANAQYRVSGTVLDQKDGQGLPGATATLVSAETGKLVGNSTDIDGKFSMRVDAGKYTLKIVFLGYTDYQKTIDVKGDMSVGTIKMKAETKELKEVKVAGTMVRQEQRGDTTVFNAAAFKVNPDATTEDLIKKMPGIQVSGNSVSSGGESVKKVLVDGKEYFGSDPMAALKNISADMVASIEVFDKQSDQSQFTGFSDGEEERTINITTKMGLTKGSFGRLYAGYGSDERYEMGGSVNVFNGNHRYSLIGMLNNVNQQSFSFEDLSGGMAMGGGRGMRGMFGGNNQGGKNRTGSIGLNYTFDDEKVLKVEFSYSYNNKKNVSESEALREYFYNEKAYGDSLRYEDTEDDSEGKRNNHRSSLRLTWTINENNSIIFTPNISWQGNKNESSGLTLDSYITEGESVDNLRLNRRLYDSAESESKNISGGGRLMWRHKFNVERRTLSLSVGTNASSNNVDQETNSSLLYTHASDKTPNLITSNISETKNSNITYNARLMYTEPLGENMALQVNYSPSYQISEGDKQVFADSVTVEGEPFESYAFSPNLSNVKESRYLRQRAGVGLNIFSGKVFNATLGLDWQHANLQGEQEYPYEFDTDKSFSSVMPSVMIRVRKNQGLNLRFHYRTNTSAPSINQMQKVVDVSNPFAYSTGNEDLEQQYSHNLMMFFAKNNIETSRAIFFMGNFSTTSNYIANHTITASKDSIIDQGILLRKGTQLTKPVNINGQYSARVNLTLSTPVKWLGSNVNFNVGANLSATPFLNEYGKQKNYNYSLTTGLTIGSSFSENCDFTVSYNGGYTIMESTTKDQNLGKSSNNSNDNYYNHSLTANLSTLFWNRLVVTTSASHTMTYYDSGNEYNQDFIMWNAAVGYKVFKDRRGEFRLRINDILSVNQSVSRMQTESYIQTGVTEVLKQYVMLTFTYKLKPKGNMPSFNFGGPGGPMGPPPGMRRH